MTVEATKNVREIKARIRANTLGQGPIVVGRIFVSDALDRIVDARTKNGILQGKRLSDDQWYAIHYAV